MMRRPEDLRARLRIAWTRNRQDWLAGKGVWPITYSTQSPTESQAQQQWSVFGDWLACWKACAGVGHIDYAERTWPRLGTQTLPQRWAFASPAAVAIELGEGERWARATSRLAAVAERFIDDAASGDVPPWRNVIARSFDLLADLSEPDFARLLKVFDWLVRHPASGLYLRQMPIAGVDSKWMESYRGVIGAWLAAHAGVDPTQGFHALSGLTPQPDRIRIRLLDPALRAQFGGLSDIATPVDALCDLHLKVQRIVVVENLATGLAFGDLPGTALLMARGYAVEALGTIPWIQQTPVEYWGDIDTHGFAILSRLRSHVPNVRSLMMDEETLLMFLDLCGEEPKQCLADALPGLTEVECDLYQALRSDRHGSRLRLEQERIPWDWAWAHIQARCAH